MAARIRRSCAPFVVHVRLSESNADRSFHYGCLPSVPTPLSMAFVSLNTCVKIGLAILTLCSSPIGNGIATKTGDNTYQRCTLRHRTFRIRQWMPKFFLSYFLCSSARGFPFKWHPGLQQATDNATSGPEGMGLKQYLYESLIEAVASHWFARI